MIGNMRTPPIHYDDAPVRCTACNGRGYRRCACWPGDCICGQDDVDCEACYGEGWVDTVEEYGEEPLEVGE